MQRVVKLFLKNERPDPKETEIPKAEFVLWRLLRVQGFDLLSSFGF